MTNDQWSERGFLVLEAADVDGVWRSDAGDDAEGRDYAGDAAAPAGARLFLDAGCACLAILADAAEQHQAVGTDGHEAVAGRAAGGIAARHGGKHGGLLVGI